MCMHVVYLNKLFAMNVWYKFTVWTYWIALIIYVTKIREFHVL